MSRARAAGTSPRSTSTATAGRTSSWAPWFERADPDDPCNTHANYPYNEQSKILINRRRGANGAWLGFRFGTEWNVSQPNSGGRLALPWDYNRDGRTDLLTGGRRAWLYRNTGTGFAEVSRAASVALPTFNGASIADITGDAIPDLVFADDTGFAYRAGTSDGDQPHHCPSGPGHQRRDRRDDGGG